MFNPTNFLQNLSHIARSERQFIHNATANIPVAREVGAGFEDILQASEIGLDEAGQISNTFIKADKNQKQLTTEDLAKPVHIFGIDVDIPKTPLEQLYNIGRRDPSDILRKMDKLGNDVNHYTGLITSAPDDDNSRT